jgi:hypothetical protein
MFFRYRSAAALATALVVLLLVLADGTEGLFGAGLRDGNEVVYPGYLSSTSANAPSYDGRIRVYLVEPTSRWQNDWGEPYHFGFLDWALDSVVSISESDTVDIVSDWYAPDHGFSSISEDNIMAIAAAFNSEGHPRYAYPSDSLNPFTAYYVDAAAGATPGNPGSNRVSSSFTHTVLVEEGTTTWCRYCPYVGGDLYAIYESGLYPFYFVSMITDVMSSLTDSVAFKRIKGELALYGYPTCYSDGGYIVRFGSSQPNEPDSIELSEHIEASGAREVVKLDMNLSLDWIGANRVRARVTVWHRQEPFAINLLPNPALPFELDVIAFPAEPLTAEPQIVVENEAGADTLTMTQLDNRDALTYSLDYRVSEAGAYFISICGFDTVGNYECSEMLFSGAPVRADQGALLSSHSGLFDLQIPPHALSGDALILCWEEAPDANNIEGVDLLSNITPLLLLRTKSTPSMLKSSAILSVDVGRLGIGADEYGSIVLLRSQDGGLKDVGAHFDAVDGTITAEITKFGTYLVALSSSARSETDQGEISPSAYRLDQNRPNPFNVGTTISFYLPEAAQVELAVYNVLGQRVLGILDEHLPPGSHDALWDGRNEDGDYCSSGVYLYRLKAGSFTEARRMLLLK